MTGNPDISSATESRIVDEYCKRFLTRDDDVLRVPDETIYAYIKRTASREQREMVEEALLRSSTFCAEMYEIVEYVESLEYPSGRFKPLQWIGEAFERLLGRRHFAVAATAVAVLIVVAVSTWWMGRSPRVGPAVPPTVHLAVLPIDCGLTELDPAFCDGLSETVASALSGVERFTPSFWVVPQERVVDASVADAEAARTRFGATVALEGRLVHVRDEFRLTLRLVSLVSPAPRQLDSVEIAGPMSDVSSLHGAIGKWVSELLNLPVAAYARSAAQGQTERPTAYQNYIAGRGHLLRYEQVDELERAVSAFSAAIADDSLYALAHTGLAESYWRTYKALGGTAWIALAREACERSLALDSALAPTHITFGNILNASGENELAIESFDRAIETDSTAAGLYNGLAEAYAGLGRDDEAEAAFRRAIAAKPDYWGGYNDLGYYFYSDGRFAEAADQYREVARLTPDNHLAFNNLGVMHYYLERWDEAKAAFESSIEIKPNDRAYLNLGTIYYIEGDYVTSAEYCRRAIELNDQNYRAWAALANAYYWIPGQRDRAVEAYRSAIDLAEQRLELNLTDARMRVTLAGYYVMVEENEKARSYAEAALDRSPEQPFVVYFAGHVFEQLGERDRALELIGRAIDLGYPVSEIEEDPWLEDFRADERFQQLLDGRD